MTPITHFCFPLICAMAVDSPRGWQDPPAFTKRELIEIGIGGMLPDIIDPHLSLALRLGSWTHSIIFVLLIVAIIKIMDVHHSCRWQHWFVFAVGSHLFLDALSGGVRLWYPAEHVVGGTLIPFFLWLPIDVVCASTAYFLWWRRFIR